MRVTFVPHCGMVGFQEWAHQVWGGVSDHESYIIIGLNPKTGPNPNFSPLIPALSVAHVPGSSPSLDCSPSLAGLSQLGPETGPCLPWVLLHPPYSYCTCPPPDRAHISSPTPSSLVALAIAPFSPPHELAMYRHLVILTSCQVFCMAQPVGGPGISCKVQFRASYSRHVRCTFSIRVQGEGMVRFATTLT